MKLTRLVSFVSYYNLLMMDQASSVLQVINIATQLTVFIPEQSVQIASLVMGIAVPLAMKLQSTHRYVLMDTKKRRCD